MKHRLGLCAFLFMLAGCADQGLEARLGTQKIATSAKMPGSMPAVPGRRPVASIANAPDKGELIGYSVKYGRGTRNGAYTTYPVSLSEEHALKAIATGTMIVPMPDGSKVQLKYERHAEDTDGNWTWVGRVVGGDVRQEAIITFGDKAVFGSIPQLNGGAPLRLVTRNGALLAVETDASKVPNVHAAGTDMMVPPVSAARANIQAAAVSSPQSLISTMAATPATTVDIAIGYTAGLAAALGGASQATTRLSYLVQVSNQAYENSQITGALRVVRAVQVDYTDTTTNKTALTQLTGRDDAGAVVTIPAALNALRLARDESGADLAVLVRKFQSPENDGCGIAWLIGSGQTPIVPAVDDDYGFAVIGDGSDAGSDGNTYFCADETMVHELGHLMGSAHDRDNSKTSTGALLYGRYPYSFGMKTAAAAGNFYTIMAYGDDSQNFYRSFSNPSVLRCGPSSNLACGVANEMDNARSLNQTIPVVATFRATVVPIGTNTVSDVNADGRSDLFLRYGTPGGLAGYWIMNGSAIVSASAALAAPSGHEVATRGDFNGDGRLDVLWSRTADRNLVMWQGNATGGFDTIGIGGLSVGWTIAAAGDVNGDGRSDLVLRYGTSGGLLGYWIMNGTAIVSASTALPAPPAHEVATTGDFNGDGRLDVLWVRESDRNLVLWQGNATGGFDTIGIGGLSTGWTISGAGDINADGRSDVFLRYGTSGGLAGYWIMNGQTIVSASAALTAPPAHEVAAKADFNGDGRMDILWSRSSDGNLVIWQGNATGGFDTIGIGGLGTGWRVSNR